MNCRILGSILVLVTILIVPAPYLFTVVGQLLQHLVCPVLHTCLRIFKYLLIASRLAL